MTALVSALNGEVGRLELRGLLSFLRSKWLRLGRGGARSSVEAEGRVLARAVDREWVPDEDLAAAVAVVRRYMATLFSSDEVRGRPECPTGCRERLVLVVEGAASCALCDAPARAPEERAA